MAQFFKAEVLDQDGFPLPERQRTQPEGGPQLPSEAEAEAARSELQDIVDTIGQLKPQVDALAAAAAESARQQGYNDGLEKAHSEVRQNLMEAVAALTEAQRERERIAGEHSEALKHLAIRIARKVIGDSFEADPTLVTTVIEDALRDIEPSYSLEVHVHPDVAQTVEESRPELERLVAGGGRINVVADPAVGPGGCTLVTPVGEVDARVETKLSVLEAALKADTPKH